MQTRGVVKRLLAIGRPRNYPRSIEVAPKNERMGFLHLASMNVLGSSRSPNLRWGMLCGYPPLTSVKWAGPLAGTCGGGLARTLYETITVIELVTLLHPGGARPDAFA